MAKWSDVERKVRRLLGPGETPESDARHVKKRYERETGNKAPAPLDYLTPDGGEQTSAFLAWYATKKRELLDALLVLRAEKPERLVDPDQAQFEWRDGVPYVNGKEYVAADAEEAQAMRDYRMRMLDCVKCRSPKVVPGFNVPGQHCEFAGEHSTISPTCSRCCNKVSHDHSWRDR